MNKTLLYAIGAVVVVGVIGFLVMSGQSGPGMMSGLSKEGSLKELLASQSPQRCTFNQQATGAESTGEVFVAGGKMRGDFSSLVNGQTVKTHMIVDSGTSYVWTDVMDQGFKISLESMTAPKDGQTQGVDINQKLNYSCNSWGVDQTVFAMPSGVTFTDMSTMMNQMMPKAQVKTTAGGSIQAGGSLQAQCGTCDQIPDAAAKAQCKIALNCK